jgi:hypothetical protein
MPTLAPTLCLAGTAGRHGRRWLANLPSLIALSRRSRTRLRVLESTAWVLQ